MREASADTPLGPHWRWLFVLALGPAFLSLNNELQDVDPTQYADVAARILRTGDWLVLQDMNGLFLNKPPLMMWSQAVLMAVLGVGTLAARLPVLAFGLAAVWGVYLVGRELRDRKLGAVAAALFGSSVAFHHMVIDPKVDMPLTAMSILSVWALLATRRRPALVWAAWLFGALGLLSKGPIGLVLPTLAVGPEWVRRGFGGKDEPLWRRVLAVKPVRGVLVVLALAGPFYFATVAAHDGEAAKYLLWTQSFGRLLGQDRFKDSTTPGYFLHTGLWAFLPFTPILLAALGRRAVAWWRNRKLPADAARVALWWLVLPLAVISFSSYKLPQYVYWLAPAGALLSARELLSWSELARSRWRWGYVGLAAVLFAGGALVLFVGLPLGTASTAAWLFVLAGIPAAAFIASRKLEAPLGAVAMCVGASAGFVAYFHAGLHPALLEYQPSREVGEVVRRVDPAGTALPFVATPTMFSVSFYAQRDLRPMSHDELAGAVRAGTQKVAVVGDGEGAALAARGLSVTPLLRLPTYPTSRPSGKFVRASTRGEALKWIELVELKPRP